LELKREVEERFKEVDIFLSFSSRMVLKDLKRRGIEYKNLPQVLADVDMLGYRNIVVASINLFPTDEHELLIRTVNGFREFSFLILNVFPIYSKIYRISIIFAHKIYIVKNGVSLVNSFKLFLFLKNE